MGSDGVTCILFLLLTVGLGGSVSLTPVCRREEAPPSVTISALWVSGAEGGSLPSRLPQASGSKCLCHVWSLVLVGDLGQHQILPSWPMDLQHRQHSGAY